MLNHHISHPLALLSMRKRKKQDQDTFRTETITVKTTFVHILSKPSRTNQVRNIFNAYLKQVNQLRFLASVVVKKYWIRLLEQDIPFTFQLDQNFFCKAFSLLSNAKIMAPQQYAFLNDLTTIAEEVKTTFGWQFNPMDGLLSQYAAVFGAQATIIGNQYVSNWHTHLTTRLQSTLQVWIKSHVRAYLTEDELKDESKSRAALKRQYIDYDNYAPFWGQNTQDRYNYLKAAIDQWYKIKKESTKKITKLENPDKPKRKRQKKAEVVSMDMDEEKKEAPKRKKPKPKPKPPKEKKDDLPVFFYEEGLKLLFQMCRDSEIQELRTGRAMKRIAFLPEYDCRMSNIQLTSEVLHWLYNALHETEKTKNNDHERIWSYFFRLGRVRRLKMSQTKLKQVRAHNAEPFSEFAYSMFTDGVSVSVMFHVKKPLRAYEIEEDVEEKEDEAIEEQSFRSYEVEADVEEKEDEEDAKPELSYLPPGLYFAKDIFEKYQGFDLKTVPFVSADPGIITPVQWYDASTNQYPPSIGHLEYRHHTNNAFTRDAAEQLRDAMDRVRVNLIQYPFERSTMTDRYQQYLVVMAGHWQHIWFQQINPKYRYGKFERYKRGQRFMDKWLSATSKFATGKIILFGNGCHKKGGFMSSRGGKAKGPVKKFRKLLSRRHPVITCSEFRTSKCCFHCGGVLLHPKGMKRKRSGYCPPFHPKASKHKQKQYQVPQELPEESHKLNGISYCQDPGHPMFYSRDRDAARKICYLFLYRLYHGADVPLGVWSHSVKVADMEGELANSKFLVEFYSTIQTIHSGLPLANNGLGNELEL